VAVITWPTDVKVGDFSASIQFDVQLNVLRNGSITTYSLPGARWMASVNFETSYEGGMRNAVEALMVSLKGGGNRLQMPYWGRLVPTGTMRGSPIVNANAASGSEQVQITSNGTLKRGDLIGILGQLLMVTADASPSGGLMTISFQPALRAAVTVGTAVTWNAPKVNWIPKTSTAGPFISLPSQIRPGLQLELVEAY
jgi:hypothetical protein